MLLPWTPSGGLGDRSTLVVGGLGADGRGFVSPASGCTGEIQPSFAAELAPPFTADARGPFYAEVALVP